MAKSTSPPNTAASGITAGFSVGTPVGAGNPPAPASDVDQTGLAGRYDFELNYTRQCAAEPAPDAPPDIFTALQEQLGLKLESARGSVPVLVIDHIERPSEN